MRATYRIYRVLDVIAQHPGASSRQVAAGAGVRDPGQISRLLARLYRLKLIDTASSERRRRGQHTWELTPRGHVGADAARRRGATCAHAFARARQPLGRYASRCMTVLAEACQARAATSA
jgi:DNA-binding MarR family transcriptional regulator